MTNAEYVARYLQSRGVTHVYELVGGMITFMLDALHRCSEIKIVSMHHEQGAAFAAEGWARMKGMPGVAFATSGPGATNLLTGVGSCYFDSVPAVFITGQVNRHEQKGGRQIRQLGFQETDIVAMARPITKAAFLVNDPDDLPRILDEAFRIAAEGRPGPVLVDIPMDVQRHVLPDSTSISPPPPSVVHPLSNPDQRTEFLRKLTTALANAKKPLILAGGGLRSGRVVDVLRNFVDHLKIPVVHSLMGVDVLPASHPQRVGLIGSYGNRWANLGLSLSDFVLVLGSRLDIRQTGSDVEGFRGARKIFHVDCQAGETNNRVTGCTVLIEEMGVFIADAMLHLPLGIAERESWNMQLTTLRQESPDIRELGAAKGINPNVLMHALSKHAKYASAFVADVGQHQMWAAQSLDLLPHQRFLTSGGMGSMGFGLPAAIGACFAAGPTILIAGDGGFQCNIQELQTVVRNQLPLKMVVLNNHCHGMVRQFQESYFKGRYQSTLWGYDAPDFSNIARAYGIDAEKVEQAKEITFAMARMSANPQKAYLLEIEIDMITNAYPKLAFGRAFGEMEPSSRPLEMEGT